jgi:predicted secreted protein
MLAGLRRQNNERAHQENPMQNQIPICGILALLPCVLCSALPSMAAPGRIVKVTEQQNGQTIKLHPGDTLSVTLHDPGDGGYSWYIVWNPGDSLLHAPVLTHSAPSKSQRPGDFGTETFRFTVPHAAGSATFTKAEWLRFLALRPWEKDIGQPSSVSYHVTVGGK